MTARDKRFAMCCGILVLIGLAICTGCTENEKATAEAELDVYREMSAVEQQRQDLAAQIEQKEEQMRKLAGEYGAGHLDSRLQMQLERVAALTQELVKVEAQRTRLEARVEVLDSISSKSVEQHNQLEQAKLELEMARAYESRMRELMRKADAEAVELGRKQMALGDLEEELAAARDKYEHLTQRIKEIEARPKKAAKKWPW